MKKQKQATTKPGDAMSTELSELIVKMNAELDRDDRLMAGEDMPDVPDDYVDLRDRFRSIFVEHNYDEAGNRSVGTAECGSIRAEDPGTSERGDTARWLYRLLFLVAPKRKVSFEDMYKSGDFLCLVSPDQRFAAHALFFKYELGVYFSAAEGCIEGRMSGVTAGHPGADNGVAMKDPVLVAWADLLKRCLGREWDVYGGNDFRVCQRNDP